MKWMKLNHGKTLEDALEEWSRIKIEKKNIKVKNIEPQFEYNTYLRDFMADNPNLKRDLGIKLWKIKRSIRGNNRYEKADLIFLTEKFLIITNCSDAPKGAYTLLITKLLQTVPQLCC